MYFSCHENNNVGMERVCNEGIWAINRRAAQGSVIKIIIEERWYLLNNDGYKIS